MCPQPMYMPLTGIEPGTLQSPGRRSSTEPNRLWPESLLFTVLQVPPRAVRLHCMARRRRWWPGDGWRLPCWSAEAVCPMQSRGVRVLSTGRVPVVGRVSYAPKSCCSKLGCLSASLKDECTSELFCSGCN
uniref:Uncharacterized protein n=1 Tax=Pipistrellus kuhlii TaxID=59472 RepID=A0A7J7RTH2_PIPKU|nr:hypothetical protein mPipKuh1_010244 [Pipistrellus kuhlii]